MYVAQGGAGGVQERLHRVGDRRSQPAAVADGQAGWHGFGRLRARRSADGIVELAVQVRHDAAQAAAAAAERAGVLIAGPLGLCFLPAFLCVGIVPLVVGLAGDVLQFGLV